MKQKRSIVILLCLTVLLLFTGCGLLQPTSLREHIERRDGEFILYVRDVKGAFSELLRQQPELEPYVGSVSTVPTLFGQKVKVSYEQPISDDITVAKNENEIVDGLTEALDHCRETGVMVLLHRQTEPQIEQYLDLARQRHPLAGFGMESIECTCSTGSFTDDSVMSYRLTYVDTPEKVKAYKEKTREQVSALTETLWHADDTDEQKVRTIHDYIIDHTYYDTEEESILIDHTAYGPLVCGKSVCDGYARAAEVLLYAANVENHLIEGKADGIDHIWNIVKLDGKWYHIDVTWDDPVSEDGKQHKIYDYYLVSDKTMQKNHEWESEYVCPADHNIK